MKSQDLMELFGVHKPKPNGDGSYTLFTVKAGTLIDKDELGRFVFIEPDSVPYSLDYGFGVDGVTVMKVPREP